MQAQLGALQEQLASAGAGSVLLGHSSRSEAVIMAALVFAPPLVVEGLEEDDVDELARVRVDSGVQISEVRRREQEKREEGKKKDKDGEEEKDEKKAKKGQDHGGEGPQPADAVKDSGGGGKKKGSPADEDDEISDGNSSEKDKPKSPLSGGAAGAGAPRRRAARWAIPALAWRRRHPVARRSR